MGQDLGGVDGGGTVSMGTGTWKNGRSPTNTFIWKLKILSL